jgi:hypothetical protein
MTSRGSPTFTDTSSIVRLSSSFVVEAPDFWFTLILEGAGESGLQARGKDR